MWAGADGPAVPAEEDVVVKAVGGDFLDVVVSKDRVQVLEHPGSDDGVAVRLFPAVEQRVDEEICVEVGAVGGPAARPKFRVGGMRVSFAVM